MGIQPSGSSAPQNEREFAQWNEEMVERYDIDCYYAQAKGLVRWVEARRLSALHRLADVRPGNRLLEVGCGGGHVLQHFTQARRTGIDLSTSMLERARKRLGAGVTLLQGSADHLPFEDNSFDVVLCTEVLEHVPDPGRVIRELLRVATPEGRVVVSIPNEKNIDLAKRIIRKTPILSSMLRTLAEEGNEWHIHQFDLSLLEQSVRDIARVPDHIAIPNRLMPIRYVARLEAIRA